ncbi:MAG TPA: hypothetical protein VKR06_08560, partial [Ktedonosporobacter sp.]|nr:hypothetical protein [Ktedonosporobacter sp.]
QANLTEIEHEVEARLAGLRSQMIKEAANPPQAAEFSPPPCPGCGTQMYSRGKQHRRLQTGHGQAIQIERPYVTCPACGYGFFPAFMRNWACLPEP